MKHLKICDFTVPELDNFRRLCNFTPDELEYFNLRSKDKTNIEIAMLMNLSPSKIDTLSRKVKSKMIRVL